MLYNAPTGASTPNDPYVGKNVAAGIQGSKVPPHAVEFPQREIVNVITAAGLTPSNNDLTQLQQAIQHFAAAAGTTLPSAIEGVKLAGGSYQSDIPGLTEEDALVNADLLEFFSQADAHHRKTTLQNLSTFIANYIARNPTVVGAFAPVPIFATQNYTVPANCYRIYARLWAPGGAGGNTTGAPNGGAGGGGGEYREGVFGVTPGQVILVTVGPGVSVGATPSVSSIGALMTAIPGQNASHDNAGSGGTGGAGGSFSVAGQIGSVGTNEQNYVSGGPGGGAFCGGPSQTTVGDSVGTGIFPGGGGSGGNGVGGWDSAAGFAIIQPLSS